MFVLRDNARHIWPLHVDRFFFLFGPVLRSFSPAVYTYSSAAVEICVRRHIIYTSWTAVVVVAYKDYRKMPETAVGISKRLVAVKNFFPGAFVLLTVIDDGRGAGETPTAFQPSRISTRWRAKSQSCTQCAPILTRVGQLINWSLLS